MPANPFKPTAGKMPPILIGREDVISDFAEGIENGAGAPSRLMLLSGQHGYGKTVLLVELARVARSYGWKTVRQTASKGMCDRIVEALREGRAQVTSATLEPSISISGVVGASLGKIGLERPSSLSIRQAITARLATMDDGKGILFTIDEAQAAQREEMVALATAIQEVIGDEDMRDVPDSRKHGVAFAFAGLPSIVDDMVNDKVLTFLQRASRHSLDAIHVPDVRNAYMQTVFEAGMRISEEEAQKAAEASEGYPYMVQLVGYYMWQAANRRRSSTIEHGDVALAIEDARRVFLDAVCAPAYRGLTKAQQTFLDAMASDWPSPSSVTTIAERLGKSRSWASAYRRSLMDANVIDGSEYGMVSYSIPHFGEYMKSK